MLTDIKEFYPVLTPIIAAIIGYYFGKVRDNDNTQIKRLDESLVVINSLLQKLTRDEHFNYGMNKKVINELSSEDLLKLSDKEIIQFLIDWKMGKKVNKEDNCELIDLLEKQFEVRLTQRSKELYLWEIYNYSHPIKSYSLRISMKLKVFFEMLVFGVWAVTIMLNLLKLTGVSYMNNDIIVVANVFAIVIGLYLLAAEAYYFLIWKLIFKIKY